MTHSPDLNAHPLWEALCCPDDHGPLRRRNTQLECLHCGELFSIEAGIPCLLPRKLRWSETVQAAAQAEQRQRDLEASRYDRLFGLQFLSIWEIPATLQALAPQERERVVEVGCGTGRLTLPLQARCRELIAVDHSLESLKILRRKLDADATRNSADVLLIQGDASRLPVCSAWATGALSSQMLEHLPSETMRGEALRELARVVQPGGRLAISAYRYWPWLRWLAPREGYHSGTIYFHRFTPSEFRSLLEEAGFRVDGLSSRLFYVLLASAVRADA